MDAVGSLSSEMFVDCSLGLSVLRDVGSLSELYVVQLGF